MGVGFAKDAEGAMRNNKNLKNSVKDKYFKNQKYKTKKKNNLNHTPASKEELLRIRNKLSLQKKLSFKRASIAGSITFLFLIYLFFFVDYSCNTRTIKQDKKGNIHWEIK
jgi:hypothetical protein